MIADWKTIGVIISICVTVGGLIAGGLTGYNYMQFTVQQNTAVIEKQTEKIDRQGEQISDLSNEIERIYWLITDEDGAMPIP